MDFDHPPADPVTELKAWLTRAEQQTGMINPNAMALATADADGRPAARMVLLKHLDDRGAVFFTNRRSRKGEALTSNPRAALLFYWDQLGLQVEIEGTVSEVDGSESDEYFASRPRGSQIGAWASDQSTAVDSRAVLEARMAEFEQRYPDQVPRPPHWGGYRVSLDRIEFWRSRLDRVHDRVVYIADGRGGWTVQRLCP